VFRDRAGIKSMFNYLVGLESVHPQRRGKEPVFLRFDAFHAREHGPSLEVYVHGGDKLLWRGRRRAAGMQREMMEGREGVGVDGAVATGNGGDDAAGDGVAQGGPRGGADLAPEILLCAEAVHERGYGCSRCQRGGVEAREDVRVDDVRVERGED